MVMLLVMGYLFSFRSMKFDQGEYIGISSRASCAGSKLWVLHVLLPKTSLPNSLFAPSHRTKSFGLKVVHSTMKFEIIFDF